MNEEIKIKIKTINNGIKGPSFSIKINDILLDKQENYFSDVYSNTFNVDITTKFNKICIEHFNKLPKDTIVEKDQTSDIAIQLIELKFNGVVCHPVDLHENFFYVTKWKYTIDKKIKNNLYFGFNGRYEYCFESPATKYILSQHKKYKKENFIMKNFDEIDGGKNEEMFVEKLEEHIKLESVTIPLSHASQD